MAKSQDYPFLFIKYWGAREPSSKDAPQPHRRATLSRPWRKDTRTPAKSVLRDEVRSAPAHPRAGADPQGCMPRAECCASPTNKQLFAIQSFLFRILSKLLPHFNKIKSQSVWHGQGIGILLPPSATHWSALYPVTRRMLRPCTRHETRLTHVLLIHFYMNYFKITKMAGILGMMATTLSFSACSDDEETP